MNNIFKNYAISDEFLILGIFSEICTSEMTTTTKLFYNETATAIFPSSFNYQFDSQLIEIARNDLTVKRLKIHFYSNNHLMRCELSPREL